MTFREMTFFDSGWCRLARLILLVALGLSQFDELQADAPLEGTKPAQWRLVWKSDPATTATLCWNTAEAGKSHAVIIGKRGEEKRTIDAQVNGQFGGNPVYFHQVQLTDLEPEAAYDVQMVSDGEKSPQFFFVTAGKHRQTQLKSHLHLQCFEQLVVHGLAAQLFD